MDRSSFGRPLAWTAAVVTAAGVVASGLVDGGSSAPGRPEGGPRVVLERGAELRIPPADEGAWRRLPSVLSATGVAGVDDGWLVLDGRSSRVHRLDRNLAWRSSFGGRGNGPGELSRPVALASAGDSLVVVLDVSGTRIDVFTPDGRFVERVKTRVPGCPAGLPGGILPSPRGYVTWGICGGPGGERWAAARLEPDGEARILASVPLRKDGHTRPPLGHGVITWRGRVWVGAPDGCFVPVSGGAGGPPDSPSGDSSSEVAGPGRVCLPDDPGGPVPDSLRRRLAAGWNGRGGGRLELPDRWPPFLATAWSARGPLLVLPPDSTSPDGPLAILEDDGSLTLLRTAGRAWPGPGGVLLARTVLDGTAFRVVPWP